MLCLLCEKKIPLHRQLAGSPFCSREHGEQHGAKQSRSGKQPTLVPPPAKFAANSPACALLDPQPDTTAFRTPIPRFSDVILCRRHLKPRYTIGVPSARVVAWPPGMAAPEAANAIAVGLQEWNRLHLGAHASSPPSATRRFSTAPLKQGAQAIQALPERILSLVGGGLRTMPWDASFRARWPGAYGSRARLVVARAFLPVLTLSNMVHPGANVCAATFAQALAKPGLHAQVTGFPPSPQLAIASFESQLAAPATASTGAQVLLPKLLPVYPVVNTVHLSQRVGLFDGAKAGGGLQAFSGIGETFTLADSETSPPIPEPLAPPTELRLPEPALAHLAPPYLRASVAQLPDLRSAVSEPAPATSDPARLQYALPRGLGKPDTSEFDFVDFVCPAAGFAAEEWPDSHCGVFQPLYDSCDFSLQPVWLASLFTLASPFAGPRRCRARAPEAIGTAAFLKNAPAAGGGPEFSGSLAFPKSDRPAKEFAEKKIMEVARPPAPRAILATRNPWRDALRLWRSVPGFARGLAVAIPLVAPAMFYAPPIAWPHLSTNQGELIAAIQARAQIDLREDFQTGLAAWTGPPGWESTWVMDRPGFAQPGRMALFQPRTPVTDYRVELQGQIQSKALGFVFRATDMNNYHAVKITIRKPGPLPSVYLVRYAMVEGRAGQKTETLLPTDLRADTLYDVLVTAQGDNFTITVNGQLVDTFSDGRLKSGGVGLFAEKGEISQVRSVHVTENVDFLGWVCSQVSRWNADRMRIGVKHE